MNPLLQQFIQESRDSLESISAELMALERAPASSERMAGLFRLVHSLKGNSGLFDFPEMTRVLHAGEDLMGAVRDGRVAYSPELADTLLDAMDFVTLQLDEIEGSGAAGAGHAADAAALAARLRALAPAAEAPVGAPAAAVAAGAAQLPLPRFEQLPEAARQAAASALQQGSPLFLLAYRPEPECFFKGEDPFHQARQLPGLLWGGAALHETPPALAEMDCYRSVLTYTMLAAAPRATLDAYFRYTPEQVRIEAVTPGDGLEACRQALLAAQGEILELPDGVAWLRGRLQATAASLRGCLGPEPAGLDAALAAALAEPAAAPLRDWLAGYDARSAAAAAADRRGAAPAQGQGRNGGDDEPAFNRRADDGQLGKVLKVDQGKVDRLMNLIGEMVVAKNGLPYLANRAEQQHGLRDLARDIKANYAVINRIAEEMQDAIMQVRMMPASVVFQRFPRLVRDISRKLGKEVQLVLEGEETEADKNIVEVLADPLIHIVRNSLDHGLEPPEDRAAAGKPRCGRLLIRAGQESDRVVIEIADDGRGIDTAAVKRKALAQGLIDPAAAEAMSEQEATELIFAPGFSTAAAITDLSGRGVGMDVVRTTIAKAGGSVELRSRLGAGTTLRLSLPLSMAVTNVMVVETDGQIFGIPMDAVVETMRLPASAIHHIKSAMTTTLRGRVIPLKPLNELLAIEAEPQANSDGELAVLVLRLHGERIGILVDGFRDVIDVILKPLPGELGRLSTYAGSALLGDGAVLMVLNPKELL